MPKSLFTLSSEKHPHAYGEDPMSAPRVRRSAETPPCVWGRRACALKTWTRPRNTPMRMGKTYIAARCPAASWKHPHAYGEDVWFNICRIRKLETPPCVWGRRGVLNGEPTQYGNTPMRMGKTQLIVFINQRIQKHPHAYGEDKLGQSREEYTKETPPCVWGRHFPAPRRRSKSGNTPMRMGKTSAQGASKCV